jgi:hypothetical protein
MYGLLLKSRKSNAELHTEFRNGRTE